MPDQPIWECELGFQVNEGEKGKVADFLAAYPHYRENKLKTTRYVGSMLPYLNFLSFILNIRKITKFFQLVKEDKVEPFRGLIERYHFLPFIGKQVELVNPIDHLDQWDLLD